MDENIKEIILTAVKKIIDNTSSVPKINKLNKVHSEKIHFIPTQYRIFGGLLQSMNIQFGNFIEILMVEIINQSNTYEVIDVYQKKSNQFKIKNINDEAIDIYITNCHSQNYSDEELQNNFNKLLRRIIENNENKNEQKEITVKHDIDLLFKSKNTNEYYYLEIKYNDDHDTGKFVDINRKFIKTYAYLSCIYDKVIPLIFFFTNKRMKGNIYVPENSNIYRGKDFFKKFVPNIDYDELGDYMRTFSDSQDNLHEFNSLFNKIVQDHNI